MKVTPSLQHNYQQTGTDIEVNDPLALVVFKSDHRDKLQPL